MAWNKANPAAGIAAKQLDNDIRTNNDALEAALGNEHDFTTGSTQTGIHTQGSARCFWQATEPLTRIGGAAFTSADLGSLWIDSDDNKMYILTATTPTWTNISTELFATFLGAARVFGSTLGVTGDFAVNTDKFTVEASSGNTVVAGTLGVSGAFESTGVATLADASSLKTSAAPTADAQIANKKYVDDQINNKKLGVWSPVTTVTTTKAKGETNTDIAATKALTDGFLIGTILEASSADGTSRISVYSDSASNPTTFRAAASCGHPATAPVACYINSFCIPIKKNDYYKVIYQADEGSNNAYTRTYYFIPFGD